MALLGPPLRLILELDGSQTQVPGDVVIPLLARMYEYLALAEDELSLVVTGR
jgi:hypothetical protein